MRLIVSLTLGFVITTLSTVTLLTLGLVMDFIYYNIPPWFEQMDIPLTPVQWVFAFGLVVVWLLISLMIYVELYKKGG